MSDPKWTPGDWRFEQDAIYASGEGFEVVVADYVTHGPDGPLLAASTTMYRALKTAESALSIKASLRAPEQRRADLALHAVRDALAAARGGTP